MAENQARLVQGFFNDAHCIQMTFASFAEGKPQDHTPLVIDRAVRRVPIGPNRYLPPEDVRFFDIVEKDGYQNVVVRVKSFESSADMQVLGRTTDYGAADLWVTHANDFFGYKKGSP